MEEARTVAVNVVVMVEIFYLLNCRSLTESMFRIGVFSNRWLFVSIGGMLVLQLLFTYLPAMNRLFSTAPIPARSLDAHRGGWPGRLWGCRGGEGVPPLVGRRTLGR